MASETTKVQPKVQPKVRRSWTKDELVARLLRDLESGPFDRPLGSKRRYPGEVEADYLLTYIGRLSRFPAKQESFLKPFRALLEMERVLGKKDEPAVRRIWPSARRAYNKLSHVIRAGGWTVGVSRQGLILEPMSKGGRAALAVLLLDEQHRLNRIRPCLSCDAWFYARFNHQRFCNDPEKKCQWNHYHTPEWRKKHREQNKKYQRDFRERTFGKRKL
jgi:hypothetical protein